MTFSVQTIPLGYVQSIVRAVFRIIFRGIAVLRTCTKIIRVQNYHCSCNVIKVNRRDTKTVSFGRCFLNRRYRTR